MQTQVKRYSVTIRGKVQHIGYRGIIEGTGRKLDLKGYVFNDLDNSVKIVCEGLQKSVDNFLSALQDFARADIESIEKKEIHEDIPLPHLFSRVATDEYYEFSRKFDIGLDYLDGIKTDTGEIRGTLVEMKGTLNSIDNTLGTFVVEQREHSKRMDEHNQWMKNHSIKMDEHNQRLEKILEKLAER
ncbi:MAG: acylphosphatase [Candidatus Methanoperedens sp.]|nr:acylphosphatase [Candidatus Methanoperedens sp.]